MKRSFFLKSIKTGVKYLIPRMVFNFKPFILWKNDLILALLKKKLDQLDVPKKLFLVTM